MCVDVVRMLLVSRGRLYWTRYLTGNQWSDCSSGFALTEFHTTAHDCSECCSAPAGSCQTSLIVHHSELCYSSQAGQQQPVRIGRPRKVEPRERNDGMNRR